MLKILIRYILIGFTGISLLFQSCSKNDLVDLTPEFSLDALTNPSSMKQVEEVLLGAYAGFRSANYYGSGSGTGGGWAMMPDVMSDNLYETLETLANSRAMADWLYQTNTGQVASFYSSPYVVIANANIVLRDVDKFTTPANQLQANRIKGQAFAIRALAHFDLFRYFAVKYDRNSTTDLALAYTKDFTVSPLVKPPRISNKEYYDAMFADIAQAVTLLANVDKVINPSAGITRPFIDRAGAYGIQARINLYAGQWAEAATAATNAINLRPLPAINQTAFSGMYNQTSVGDMIWNVQFESGQSGPTFLVFFATNNRSYFRPAPEIATVAGNTGLIQSNDVRYSAFFTSIGGRLAVTKYKGKGTVSDGNANFIAIRTGEMYLIRAEANARIGGANEVQALADYNALRTARITGYVPEVLTGTALLSAIADERRRELFAEGHRFFDLKRTTRTINRGIACGNTALSVSGDCTLNPTDREWALPIPEGVRNANENMVQNTGY
ncbi:MAG TPA: RagB/SusD family nutrient uptake outer membrane protein [Chitinophagaceae bacterium]